MSLENEAVDTAVVETAPETPSAPSVPNEAPVSAEPQSMEDTIRAKLREITGGQGTLNVPCWAPDASACAYVRYEI